MVQKPQSGVYIMYVLAELLIVISTQFVGSGISQLQYIPPPPYRYSVWQCYCTHP